MLVVLPWFYPYDLVTDLCFCVFSPCDHSRWCCYFIRQYSCQKTDLILFTQEDFRTWMWFTRISPRFWVGLCANNLLWQLDWSMCKIQSKSTEILFQDLFPRVIDHILSFVDKNDVNVIGMGHFVENSSPAFFSVLTCNKLKQIRNSPCRSYVPCNISSIPCFKTANILVEWTSVVFQTERRIPSFVLPCFNKASKMVQE